MSGLSCGMWDLVAWPWIKPGSSVREAWSLSHWTMRKVPKILFFFLMWTIFKLFIESTLNTLWEDLCCSASSFTLAIWCEQLTHWKRPWCWKRLKAEGEEGKRGRDGWMASLIQWTWTWVNSWRWWGTGKPSVLQSMGSQRVGKSWATEQVH